jgi:hypothetical protein
MAQFEVEVIRRFECVRTITVRAGSEEEAEDKVQLGIEKGEYGLIEIQLDVPEEWDVSVDETDYQIR